MTGIIVTNLQSMGAHEAYLLCLEHAAWHAEHAGEFHSLMTTAWIRASEVFEAVCITEEVSRTYDV